jgi:hypothetical protein
LDARIEQSVERVWGATGIEMEENRVVGGQEATGEPGDLGSLMVGKNEVGDTHGCGGI